MKTKIKIRVIEDEVVEDFIYNAIVSDNKILYTEKIDGNIVKTRIDLKEKLQITKSGYVEYVMTFTVGNYQSLKYNYGPYLLDYTYITNKVIKTDGYIEIKYRILVDNAVTYRTIIINY